MRWAVRQKNLWFRNWSSLDKPQTYIWLINCRPTFMLWVIDKCRLKFTKCLLGQMCTVYIFLLPACSLKSQKIPLIKYIPRCTCSLPRPKGWMLLLFKFGEPEIQSFASGWQVASTCSCILEDSGFTRWNENNIKSHLTKGVVLVFVCWVLLGNEYISLLLNLVLYITCNTSMIALLMNYLK